MTRPTWPAKDPREKLVAAFSYGNALGESESIVSAIVTCTTAVGDDAAPSALLDGDPVISGGDVLQAFHGGFTGVNYRLDCVATLSSGRILVLAATLPVRTA
jgi:hypothetical protein